MGRAAANADKSQSTAERAQLELLFLPGGCAGRCTWVGGCPSATVLASLRAPCAPIVTSLVSSCAPVLTSLHARCLSLGAGYSENSRRREAECSRQPHQGKSRSAGHCFRLDDCTHGSNLPGWRTIICQCAQDRSAMLIHINSTKGSFTNSRCADDRIGTCAARCRR